MSGFERILSTFSAIRAFNKRSHAKMVLFREYQETLNIHSVIIADVFKLFNLRIVIIILEPVQAITKSISYSSSRVGDVLPLFNGAIDTLEQMDVTSDALSLKSAAAGSLTDRVQMLLTIDELLTFSGRLLLSTKPPTEFCSRCAFESTFSCFH